MREIGKSPLEFPLIKPDISYSFVYIDSEVDKLFYHDFAVIRDNEFVDLILRRIVMMNERNVDLNSGLIDDLNHFKVFKLHILLFLFNVRGATIDLICESLTIL